MSNECINQYFHRRSEQSTITLFYFIRETILFSLLLSIYWLELSIHLLKHSLKMAQHVSRQVTIRVSCYVSTQPTWKSL